MEVSKVGEVGAVSKLYYGSIVVCRAKAEDRGSYVTAFTCAASTLVLALASPRSSRAKGRTEVVT